MPGRQWHFNWTHETSRSWPLLIITAADDMWLAGSYGPTEPELGGGVGLGDPEVVYGRGDPDQPPEEVEVAWRFADGSVHRQVYRKEG